MNIELFFDGLDRRDRKRNIPRLASRGIIRRDDFVLMLYYPLLDVYVFPGGGVEGAESIEACLRREVLEETGYHLMDAVHKVSVREYFVDSTWENNYFVCRIDETIAKENPTLTETEKTYGQIEYLWMTDDQILTLLDTYESTNEFGSHILEREFIGFFNSF